MSSARQRSVLVTGGTRGIGAALSRYFLAREYRVIVTARTEGSVEAFMTSLSPDEAESTEAHVVDFSIRESSSAFEASVTEMPSLDALVNNAGTNINNPIEQLRDEDLEYLNEVNLLAPIRLMRAATAPMRRAGAGRIVNIASIWSEVTRGGRLAYTAAKTGLVGATRTAAVDLAEAGILVNAVSPGFTMTELTRRTLSEDDVTALSERVPMQRFADPSEMAPIVFHLCSEENSYITGQNIVVDGGFTIV